MCMYRQSFLYVLLLRIIFYKSGLYDSNMMYKNIELQVEKHPKAQREQKYAICCSCLYFLWPRRKMKFWWLVMEVNKTFITVHLKLYALNTHKYQLSLYFPIKMIFKCLVLWSSSVHCIVGVKTLNTMITDECYFLIYCALDPYVGDTSSV